MLIIPNLPEGHSYIVNLEQCCKSKPNNTISCQYSRPGDVRECIVVKLFFIRFSPHYPHRMHSHAYHYIAAKPELDEGIILKNRSCAVCTFIEFNIFLSLKNPCIECIDI